VVEVHELQEVCEQVSGSEAEKLRLGLTKADWVEIDFVVKNQGGEKMTLRLILDGLAWAANRQGSESRYAEAFRGLRSELEAIAPPNVTWLGKCTRPEVIRHLESSWALFTPTYADTGPTVIKEARVVGLPIITTTGAGACSYVTTTGCGHVTEPGDLEALAGALLDVCGSRARAMELGAMGLVEQRITLHPKTTAKKFAAIYREFR
jgi:glycosyltransferase involved in cell wall biosynthesis